LNCRPRSSPAIFTTCTPITPGPRGGGWRAWNLAPVRQADSRKWSSALKAMAPTSSSAMNRAATAFSGCRKPRAAVVSTPQPPRSPCSRRPRTSRWRSTAMTSRSIPTAPPAPAARTCKRTRPPSASPTSQAVSSSPARTSARCSRTGRRRCASYAPASTRPSANGRPQSRRQRAAHRSAPGAARRRSARTTSRRAASPITGSS